MYPMEYWWHGGWWFMWIIPIGFLIVFAIFLLRGGPACWRGRDRGESRESALDILDRRYASGEITKEQYAEMKRVLKG